MKYYMLIGIGPVQDFIASARRSRDLWFSSWLLSELSKAAAKAVASSPENSLIFPNPIDPKSLEPNSSFNVANNVAALVSQSPAELGPLIKEQVNRRLQAIWDGVLAGLAARDEDFDRNVATLQVNDLVECVWVGVPLKGNYAEARSRALSLLAARKATRRFDPVPWQGRVGRPKSALDGQRESVIYEALYKQEQVDKLYRYFKARPAERLSGVDLLKRLGSAGHQQNFPSTSHMAARPFLDRLEKDKSTVQPKLERLVNILEGLGMDIEKVPGADYSPSVFKDYDGVILFESRLQEDSAATKSASPNVQKAVQAIREFIKGVGDGRAPYPYYALLLADGDRMGQAISARVDEEAHQLISAALSEFAGNVSVIVKKHKGAPVYAGGDDVLAFLPVHTVLACAKELADTFQEKMSGFKPADADAPTLSAGIAIAHHLMPLSDTLELARAAEKTAKGVKDKNALAITLSKRSGADRTIQGKWGQIDERLNLFIKLHLNDDVPDGAAYQLRDLHNRILNAGTEISQELQETLKKASIDEAIRILQRKQRKRGQSELRPEDLKTLQRLVRPEIEGTSTLADEPLVSVGQLAEELIIAAELAQAKDIADMNV